MSRSDSCCQRSKYFKRSRSAFDKELEQSTGGALTWQSLLAAVLKWLLLLRLRLLSSGNVDFFSLCAQKQQRIGSNPIIMAARQKCATPPASHGKEGGLLGRPGSLIQNTPTLCARQECGHSRGKEGERASLSSATIKPQR